MQHPLRTASLLLAALCLSACRSPAPPPVDQSLFTGLFRGMADCRAQYAKLDELVKQAGVANAAYHRVPGYPYLRTDRLMASFVDDIDTFSEVNGWLRRMRELDQEAREYEYMNLGMSLKERANQRTQMLNCGKTLAALEIGTPEALERVKAAIQLSDDYSSVQRSLGAYPLAVPLLKARLDEQRAAVIRDHQQAGQSLGSDAPLTLWQAATEHDPQLIPATLDQQFTDELGVPGLTTSGWKALVEAHAPALWIETKSAADMPGSPRWTASGPRVDSSQPSVYYHIDYARFGGEVLVQLNYFIWFAGGANVANGAPIDSMVWRVTLDRFGNAMVYESMHNSGRDHRWYPVQALQRRNDTSFWEQRPFFPSDSLAPSDAALRLAAGSHSVRGVIPQEQTDAQLTRRYTLQRYDNLYFLPRPEGGTRSLFNDQGLVPATHVDDPVWLWSSGLGHPGMLRQYGHHPTAYIGRRHFDDPRLLDSVFVAPNNAATAKSEASKTAAQRRQPHQNNWARHH